MAQVQRLAITSSQFQQEQILLTPLQLHYLGCVLRLCDGDRFIAIDGKGKWWLAQLQGEKAQILESLTVETELYQVRLITYKSRNTPPALSGTLPELAGRVGEG